MTPQTGSMLSPNLAVLGTVCAPGPCRAFPAQQLLWFDVGECSLSRGCLVRRSAPLTASPPGSIAPSGGGGLAAHQTAEVGFPARVALLRLQNSRKVRRAWSAVRFTTAVTITNRNSFPQAGQGYFCANAVITSCLKRVSSSFVLNCCVWSDIFSSPITLSAARPIH